MSVIILPSFKVIISTPSHEENPVHPKKRWENYLTSTCKRARFIVSRQPYAYIDGSYLGPNTRVLRTCIFRPSIFDEVYLQMLLTPVPGDNQNEANQFFSKKSAGVWLSLFVV